MSKAFQFHCCPVFTTQTLNLPDNRVPPRQKYIGGLTGSMLNSYTQIFCPCPSPIFHGVKSAKLTSMFDLFDALWFGNEAKCQRSTCGADDCATFRVRYFAQASPSFYRGVLVPHPAKISSQIWLLALPARALTSYPYTLRPQIFFSTLGPWLRLCLYIGRDERRQTRLALHQVGRPARRHVPKFMLQSCCLEPWTAGFVQKSDWLSRLFVHLFLVNRHYKTRF